MGMQCLPEGAEAASAAGGEQAEGGAASAPGGAAPDEGARLRDLAAGRTGGEEDGSAAVAGYLRAAATSLGTALASEGMAAALDKRLGALPSFQREAFLVPTHGGLPETDASLAEPAAECVYLVGHSLGLQPRRVRELVHEELDSWAQLGVNGHFSGRRPWMPIDEHVIRQSAELVGALPSEVAVMNSLTVNLHLLLVSFYRPAGRRTRILYEGDAFGSDFFAFQSQVRLHGLEPSEALLPLCPRKGEDLLRTEDIVAAIEAAGDTLSVVCLGTVQYYTGQYFDVERITEAAHRAGASALWDCAHAAANVDLRLHDWGVDGACWCTYKYLNSGPGGIGGFFVHERHHGKGLPLLAGWWGQREATRFDMAHRWEPEGGASAWRLSNPPVLQTVSLLASLEVFGRTTMAELRGRSMLLTGYLELLLQGMPATATRHVSVITPSDPRQRGAQLSIKFDKASTCLGVFTCLERRGVVVDHRKPLVIRVAPAPLYNTFTDVFRFARSFGEAMAEVLAAEEGQAPAAKRAKV